MKHDEERIYKIGGQLDIPKQCIANTIKEIQSWIVTARLSDSEVTTLLKIALREIQLRDKLNGASVECPYCQSQEEDEDIFITNDFVCSASINPKEKIIEYDGGNSDYIEINFCPFCGRKL